MQYNYNLREIRKENDKTQKEIAKILNTTFQYYSAYEREIRDIPSKHIKTLSEYYNISADYLLGLTDEKRELHKK